LRIIPSLGRFWGRFRPFLLMVFDVIMQK